MWFKRGRKSSFGFTNSISIVCHQLHSVLFPQIEARCQLGHNCGSESYAVSSTKQDTRAKVGTRLCNQLPVTLYSLYDFHGIFTSVLCALVNMAASVVSVYWLWTSLLYYIKYMCLLSSLQSTSIQMRIL